MHVRSRVRNGWEFVRSDIFAESSLWALFLLHSFPLVVGKHWLSNVHFYMSSRAASGRKRLVPKPTTLPNNQSTRNTNAPSTYQMPWRATPSSPPSSSFSRNIPSRPQPARDISSDQFSNTPGDVTPYPQTPIYEPPPRRAEKMVLLQPSEPPNSSPGSPAPSYSPPSGLSDRNESRRNSSRALPPYPSPPPTQTGWAALPDSKVAAAVAVPPSYLHPSSYTSNVYPSSPLQSPEVHFHRSELPQAASVASSSRTSTTLESTEAPRLAANPPYYTPPSSPPQSIARLPLGTVPPLRSAQPYSPEASAYPRPRSDARASPALSLASLPIHSLGRLDVHQLPTPTGSSGGSLLSASAGMQSTPSVSSSSSSSSDFPPASPASSTSPGAPFVFPSSRSRARPGAASSGFRLRGRRKLKDKMRAQEEGLGIVEEPRARAQTVPAPVALSTRALPPRSSISTVVSAAPTAAPPQQTFFFPSSRTRAHPKSATQITFNAGRSKNKEGGGEGGNAGKFLRLGIHRKKIVVVDASSGVPVSPRSRSSMESTSRPQRSSQESELRNQNRTPPSTPPPLPQVVTKIGTYPLDAYDAALIENDRLTWDLLRALNPNHTPSFHDYGARPPHFVLDLGCGAGHWALDAAAAWRDGGTQIIGFDMVDAAKAVMWGQRHAPSGGANNIKFVKGNFLRQPLPFPDEYFDLVRIANLALCVPHERWEFVLQQAHRVLAVGGRLEFIDDQVFFPYGKPAPLAPPVPEQQQLGLAPPHLDTTIPSTGFSRLSLADVVNGGREDTDSEIYNLYEVEEEDEDEDGGEHSDTDTVALGSRRRGLETPTPHDHGNDMSGSAAVSPGAAYLENNVDPEMWHEQAASAHELEALFEQMMVLKFGINLRPAEFIFGVMSRVFGGSTRELAKMHVTLAPPEAHRPPLQSSSSDALGQSPGLILWPSTFIPMSTPELETHVSKHLRVLLSCKSALVDYAAEVADQDERDSQGEEAMEALWEYQNFLRERFNPPPEDPARSISDSDDANSIRGSIFSVSSVGSDTLEAMRDYGRDLTGRFEWSEGRPRQHEPRNSNVPPARSSVGEPLRAQQQRAAPPPTIVTPPPEPASASASSLVVPQRKSRRRGSRGRDRSASLVPSVAPPYSRIELTHVRTFFVYEAVKMGEGSSSRFGGR